MNWAALQAAVSAWANRTDLSASLLTTMMRLAEQRIFIGDQGALPLRHPAMLTAVTLTPSNGQASTPADFIELERVCALGSGAAKKTPLSYLAPAQLAPYELLTSTPQFFGLRANALVFGPRFPDQVEVLYYARPATPSDSGDENWIMRDISGLYLYGMLIEVGLYLRDDALAAQARGLYQSALRAAQAAGDQQQWGGMTPLTISAR